MSRPQAGEKIEKMSGRLPRYLPFFRIRGVGCSILDYKIKKKLKKGGKEEEKGKKKKEEEKGRRKKRGGGTLF